MLIRFSIENFLSFKNREVFSMIAGRGGRDKNFHLVKKSNRNDVNLLKTAVVFGANASGKSNLIKAVDFGKQLVLKGSQANKPIHFQSFRLHESCVSAPSRIEYEIKHKGKSYAYGFIFSKNAILEEWLYEIGRTKESLIFERGQNNGFQLNPLLKLNSNQEEKQFLEFTAKGTPDNQLFLTEIKTRKVKDNVTNIDDLLNVIDWFQNSLTIFYPTSKINGVEFELKRDNELSRIFNEFLEYFDTGISGVSLEKVDFDKIRVPEDIREEIREDLLNEKSEKTNAFVENSMDNARYIFTKENESEVSVSQLMTKHRVHGVTGEKSSYFDINEESDGTQRLLDFIPLLIDLFKGGNVFLIDEMERSLHPNIIYDLLDLFLTKCEGLPSQLILASHESSLLTQKLLRKDEVWFTVKDEFGASSIHSLEDYEIRFDKQIQKDYLLGRYKAIPRIGNRNNLSALKI